VDFAFTEEQQQLRRSVREFAEARFCARMEWDEASHFRWRSCRTGGDGGCWA